MSKIENAQTSCSLSTLALLAKGMDVPVTSLFRGADVERPAAFVKAGSGARIVRNGTREGHEYQLLGSLRREHKRLECSHLTLSEKSQTYPLPVGDRFPGFAGLAESGTPRLRRT